MTSSRSLVFLLATTAFPLASGNYAAELASYTIAVMQYLTHSQIGTFECIFLDFHKRPVLGSAFNEVLRSPRLDHVVRHVVDGNFQGDPFAYPKNPSLLIIHAGSVFSDARKFPKSFMNLIVDCKAHTKIMIFVDMVDGRYFYLMNDMIAAFQFSKVAFLGTNRKLVIEPTKDGQIRHMWQYFPPPKELLTSNIRDLRGFAITYTTIDPGFNNKDILELTVHLRWIQELARHLNTTSRRVFNPCIKYPMLSECFILFMSNSFIDVTLDVVFPSVNNTMDLIYLKIPDTHVVLVPRGRTLTVFELFVAPFTPEAWAALLVIIISLELVSFTMPSFFRNDPALLLICGLERYDLHKATRWEKMILLAFIIFFFLITNAYETKIISMMTSKPTLGTVKTIEELVASGMPTKVPFKNLGTWDMSMFKDTLTNSSDTLFEMDHTSAYLATRIKSEMYIPIFYSDDHSHQGSYAILEETLELLIGAMATSDHNPLQEFLVWSESAFFEAGFFDYFRECHVVESFYRRLRFKPMTVIKTMLAIEDLLPAWLALGIGSASSFLLFGVELLIGCYKKKRAGFKRVVRVEPNKK